MKVLFFTQTTQNGASARYRVYQFLDYLKNGGIDCSVSPAVSDELLKAYLKSSSVHVKFHFYASQILKRVGELVKTRNFDIIFFQRDTIVYIYPVLEKIIALLNKNIIFDFDDPIYLSPLNKKVGLLFDFLWDRKKIERIIKLSKYVIVGNNFLKNYAANFTKNVTVIPTSVNLSQYKSLPKLTDANGKVTIGWTGSQGTFNYLKKFFPIFIELAKKYKIELKVIGAYGPEISGLKITYKDWNLNSEINEISSFDIGVMPLTNDEWSRGKSATKLLQYMAAGVPAVASPIGVNSEIIQDGTNGFLADSFDEWMQKISYLINDRVLANRLSLEAKKTVAAHYSTEVNAPKLIKVIKDVYKKD